MKRISINLLMILGILVLVGPQRPCVAGDELIGGGNVQLYATDSFEWQHTINNTSEHRIVAKWTAYCTACACPPGETCGVKLEEGKFYIKYKKMNGTGSLYVNGAVHTDGPYPGVCHNPASFNGNNHIDSVGGGNSNYRPYSLHILSFKAFCICCDGLGNVVSHGAVEVENYGEEDGVVIPLAQDNDDDGEAPDHPSGDGTIGYDETKY